MLARLAAPAILISAVIAVGCGDNDESSASGSSLSGKEFVAKANAICRRSEQKLTKEIANYVPPRVRKNPNKVIPARDLVPETFPAVVLPALEKRVEAIRKLGAPTGEEDQVEAIVASMQQNLAAAKAKTPASATAFIEDFEASSDLARDYGLEACALG